MSKIKLVIFSLVILSQVSCVTAKKQNMLLDGYRTELLSALKDDVSTEQKVDILGYSLVDMMRESLNFKSSVKAGKFVKKFGEQNSDVIQDIIQEIQSSMGDDPMSQMGFAMGLMNKPYVSELIELIPEFEKKFKRIAWVANTLGKISKPLGMLKGAKGGAGGLNLGDFLGQE